MRPNKPRWKPDRIPWKKKHNKTAHTSNWRTKKFHWMLSRLHCPERRPTLYEMIVKRFCPGVL